MFARNIAQQMGQSRFKHNVNSGALHHNSHHVKGHGIDSLMGISNDEDGSFTELGFRDQDEIDELIANSTSETIEKWRMLTEKLLQNDIWAAVRKLLDKIPDEILELYNRLELTSEVKLEESARKTIYKKFNRMAATNFGELHSWEVETLIRSEEIEKELGTKLSSAQLSQLVKEQLETDVKSNLSSDPEKRNVFDFERFVTLIYEILRQQDNVGPPEMPPEKRIYTLLFPFDPDSTMKQGWDCWILLLLIFCSFSIPYTMAFSSEDGDNAELSPVEIISLMIDAIFMIDIALNFVTAYDNQGFMVRKLRDIARNYLRTWFIPDLAGSVPFDLIMKPFLAGSSGSGGAVQVMRILKVVRMIKLIRAIKFLTKLNELKDKEGFHGLENLIGIFRALFLIFFIAHLYSSFFTMLLSDSGPNWITQYEGGALVDADNWTRYVAAFYWAMVSLTTMGYGDIIPANHNERMFCILVAITGAIVFSYCMGTIASLISAVKSVDDRVKTKVQTVQEYLSYREISVGLKRKIKGYYTVSWRKSGGPYFETDILDELTPPLSVQVLQEIGIQHQKELPILQGFSHECIGYIFSRLSTINFEEGDVIYRRGDLAVEMYFISSGTVVLDLDASSSGNKDLEESSKSSCKEVCKGQTFGELALFPDISKTSLRPETAVANSWVMVYCLSLDQVEDCERRYPTVIQKLRQYCILKALECRALNLLPVCSSSDSIDDRGTDIQLNICIAELQRDLLRTKEDMLLKATSETSGSDVMKLMLNVHQPEEQHKSRLQSISCALSSQGEFLCIHHNFEGLAVERPISLGFLVPDRSFFRSLPQEEISRHRVKKGKKLYGCSLLVFPSPGTPGHGQLKSEGDDYRANETAATFTRPESTSPGTTIELFSSSQDEFRELQDAVRKWVSMAPGSIRSPTRSNTAKLSRNNSLKNTGSFDRKATENVMVETHSTPMTLNARDLVADVGDVVSGSNKVGAENNEVVPSRSNHKDEAFQQHVGSEAGPVRLELTQATIPARRAQGSQQALPKLILLEDTLSESLNQQESCPNAAVEVGLKTQFNDGSGQRHHVSDKNNPNIVEFASAMKHEIGSVSKQDDSPDTEGKSDPCQPDVLSDAVGQLERLLAIAQLTAAESLRLSEENRRLLQLLQIAKDAIVTLDGPSSKFLTPLCDKQKGSVGFEAPLSDANDKFVDNVVPQWFRAHTESIANTPESMLPTKNLMLPTPATLLRRPEEDLRIGVNGEAVKDDSKQRGGNYFMQIQRARLGAEQLRKRIDSAVAIDGVRAK